MGRAGDYIPGRNPVCFPTYEGRIGRMGQVGKQNRSHSGCENCPGGTAEETKRPTWRRWFLFGMVLAKVGPQVGGGYFNKRKADWAYGPTHFPPIKAGGGRPKVVRKRLDRINEHHNEGVPVALGTGPIGAVPGGGGARGHFGHNC